MFRFSRSHIESLNFCPYSAYLRYWFNKTGIETKKVSIYPLTGEAVHSILTAIIKLGPEAYDALLDIAKEQFTFEAETRGFLDAEDDYYEINRQLALVEALTRCWVKQRLPYFNATYKLLSSEVEVNVPFGDNLELMSRVDCKVQRLSDGAVFAGPEFKTTGKLDDFYLNGWRYSPQILTHMLDVEHSFGECSGVLMEFLYKGQKRKDQEGKMVYYSPLIRAFKKVPQTEGMSKRAWDLLPELRFGYEASGKQYYEPFDTWEYPGGIKGWLQVLPQSYQEAALASTQVFRNHVEKEEWKRQTTKRMALVAGDLEVLYDPSYKDFHQIILDEGFPKRLDQECFSNKYGKSCPYLGVCYEAVDPLDQDKFISRNPHHSQEFGCEEF